MEQSKARDLHKQALNAREHEQDFEKALHLDDSALLEAQKAGDLAHVAEVIADRAITLKLLFQQTKERAYLVVAAKELEAAVTIASSSDDPLASYQPNFKLGEIYEELSEFEEAIDAYQKAIDTYTLHTRSEFVRHAHLGDMKSHLASAQYRSGNKEALSLAEEALKQVQDADEEDKYAKDVWLSGCFLRLARMLQDDDRVQAQEYLYKAKEIIDANDQLVLRKKQWEELSQSI